MRKIFGESCFVLPSLNGRDKDRNYARKKETRVDRGRLDSLWKGGKGRRSDLAECCNIIKQGGREDQIIDAMPVQYVRYYRGLERMINKLQAPRSSKTQVTVLFGPPMTGKTYFDDVDIGTAKYYSKPTGTIWWDGYQWETHTKMDEFNGWYPMSNTLELFNHGEPHQVQVKGEYRN